VAKVIRNLCNVLMIHCKPNGIFSAGFTLTGDISHTTLDFSWFTESGTIKTSGHSFEVSRDGIFSGRWHLRRNGESFVVAEKTSAFRRSIEITHGHQRYLLKARSAFGRSMALSGPGVDATISPSHPFTRRSSITGTLPPPEVIAFAFWLIALLWKRAANNNSNSS
jgi:hypothetical protein